MDCVINLMIREMIDFTWMNEGKEYAKFKGLKLNVNKKLNLKNNSKD